MKEWKILMRLEFEWRIVRINRKLVNWLVSKGMKLSSPILCLINRYIDDNVVVLARYRQLYEQITGQIIKYYKKDKV